MGAVASIDKCYKDVCCPKELKYEMKSSFNQEVENKNNSNLSINNENDEIENKKENIFAFEHDEYNIYNNNDSKIEAHNYDNNNNDINLYENNFKNYIEGINEDNNFFDSSHKSGINSSNFSFKCFMKNPIKDNGINNKIKLGYTYNKNKINFKNENNDNSKNNSIQNISDEYILKVIKIQKLYKIHLKRKKIQEKKFCFEEIKENGKKKSKEENLPTNIILNKIKSSKNYSSLLLNRYLIDIDFIDVSEESFRSVTMKSNKLNDLEPPQFCTLRDLDNDQVKGYFLLKKKMFKYQGKKDKEGKKTGFGRIFWEDSSKLKGYFSDSKLNGVVYFYNFANDISTFYGEYRDNIPNGYGLYSRRGYSLEGSQWNKNILNGIGIAIWEEGEMYEGEFKNSVKEGIGLYRWVDGTTYVGEFKKNKINGIGKMTFANGNAYEGEFEDGFITGWGKFVWDDGKYYIGNYLKDKKHGFGIFVWSLDPLISLIGFWNQGKQSGICIKLFKGHCKIVFVNESKSNLEIHTRYEISKYLLPSQVKHKNFFKKKYHEYAKFISLASK